MQTVPAHLLGAAYQGSTAWETLETMVDIEDRMPGHDGEAAAAEALADQFRAVGLRDVTVEEFPIQGWWRNSSAIELIDAPTEYVDTRSYEGPHQVLALPGASSGEVQGRIAGVGYGMPAAFNAADLEGALAMVSVRCPNHASRWLHQREKYDLAVDNGAVGVIFRNHIEGCLPPTASVGGDGSPREVPAVGVSHELGRRLVRYCDRGEVTARLRVDCRSDPTTSHYVTGVTGPDPGKETLVTAHHDSHDITEGASDNAAGSALVVEAGRLLGFLEESELGTSIRCVTFGAEEINLRGSTYAAEQLDLERVAGVINIDDIGGTGEMAVATHGFDQLGAAFESVSQELSIPIGVHDTVVPHSDHWPFVKRGIPGAMVRSKADGREHRWAHTHADTLDKLDPRDLREVTIGAVAGVYKIATAPELPEQVPRDVIETRTTDSVFDSSS